LGIEGNSKGQKVKRSFKTDNTKCFASQICEAYPSSISALKSRQFLPYARTNSLYFSPMFFTAEVDAVI